MGNSDPAISSNNSNEMETTAVQRVLGCHGEYEVSLKSNFTTVNEGGMLKDSISIPMPENEI